MATSDCDLELIKEQWTLEQLELCNKIVEEDSDKLKKENLSLIGGLDISFIVGDSVNACACYVVVNKCFEIVYKDLQMVELFAPYIPGFLAFREAGVLCQLVEKQKQKNPNLTPDVILVDGNGILHPRQYGTACHIGHITGLPTVGVAKNLHLIDQLGDDLSRDNLKSRFSHLTDAGEFLSLTTREGKELGVALKTSSTSRNPVFVSVGSNVSLSTAIHVVINMSRYRIPEPIRQADQLSREFLRLNHPTQKQIQAVRQPGKTKRQKQEQSSSDFVSEMEKLNL